MRVPPQETQTPAEDGGLAFGSGASCARTGVHLKEREEFAACLPRGHEPP